MKKFQKRVTKFLFLLLLLTGCSAPPAGQQDLFTDSLRNRATSDALLQQAQFQEQFLTASAQAPIIDITSTAAAFAMEQAYAQATSTAAAQTQVAAMTVTAQSWTPTPNGTSTAESMAFSAQATQTKLYLERQEISNQFNAIIKGVFALSGLLAAIVLLMVFVRDRRNKPVETDEHGRIKPYIDTVHGTVVDIERMPNYRGSSVDTVDGLLMELIRSKLNLPDHLPAVTAERQDLVTARAQMVDMATRARLTRRLLESLEAQQQGLLPDGLQNAGDLFALPKWDEISAWNFDKDLIPLGKSKEGLECWDVRNYAHLAIFGRSRTGKSRRSLRPLVTMLLASGQRVVLVGKEIDFLPFVGHPNVVFVPIYDVTERVEAMKYFNVLSVSVAEKNRRIKQMSMQGHSLWQGARTYLVFDELGNAIIEMDHDIGDDTLRKARSIANEAGKAGLSLVFSAQRPKGFVDLTTQCGRVVFQVESDQEKGYALGYKGADKLPAVPTGYFYRKFSSVKVLGAFEPTDDEIKAFLTSRPVDKVEEDDQWIEGVISAAPAKLPDATQTPSQASEESPATSLADLVAGLDNKGMKVIELYQVGGMSDSEIGELAYGFSNGTIVRRVKRIIEQYRELKVATTTTPHNSPNLEAVAT